MKRKIIIVTQDFSGLGFAKIAHDQGDDVLIAYKPSDKEEKDDLEKYETVGEGIVDKVELDKAIKLYRGKGYYWIFDMNYLSEYSEKLRSMGEKVFGASKLTDDMEHKREFGTEIAKKAGLQILPTFECKTLEDGIAFLEQHKDEAWVFKPDEADESDLTFVPSNWEDEDANNELQRYMKSLDYSGTYILQKRVKGLEANVEVWIYKGTPFFAFCTLENKKKLNHDAGMAVGCSQDILFTIQLDSKLVKNTVGKMFSYYQGIRYTGFADMNVIIQDNNFWFIEFCNRWGYNSHPNLFINLAIDNFGDIICDFIDGKIQDFYKHFRYGFGASITLYIDKPKPALPLYIKDCVKKDFFHFDTFAIDDELYLAGYCKEVGIICKHGFTIEEAAGEALACIDTYEEISYPNIAYRSDLSEDNWPTSPRRRYTALKAMNLI